MAFWKISADECCDPCDWNKNKAFQIFLEHPNAATMPRSFIFEIILIFQSTLMELEMELLYDGNALPLTSPLTKNLVNAYFRKILNKWQRKSARLDAYRHY